MRNSRLDIRPVAGAPGAELPGGLRGDRPV
jgi:hypothetical protein